MLWDFFKKYPTAESAREADWRELATLLNPLGLHEKRAQIIIRFSGEHLSLFSMHPTYTNVHIFTCTHVHVLYIYTHTHTHKLPSPLIPPSFLSLSLSSPLPLCLFLPFPHAHCLSSTHPLTHITNIYNTHNALHSLPLITSTPSPSLPKQMNILPRTGSTPLSCMALASTAMTLIEYSALLSGGRFDQLIICSTSIMLGFVNRMIIILMIGNLSTVCVCNDCVYFM